MVGRPRRPAGGSTGRTSGSGQRTLRPDTDLDGGGTVPDDRSGESRAASVGRTRSPKSGVAKARPGVATFSGTARESGAALPSREQVRQFIADSPGRVGKREIARAFSLGAEQRGALRGLLKSLAGAGEAAPAGHKRFRAPGRLPEATLVRVTGNDPDGDPVGRPVSWEGDGPVPVVFMAREPSGQAALAPGATVLARLRPLGPGRYEGRTLKRIEDSAGRLLGAFRADGAGGRLLPTDRRQKAEWAIPPGETMGAATDDIVLAEPLPQNSFRAGLRPARVVEKLGRLGEARSVSLIAIAAAGIPDVFPAEALTEARRARAPTLGRRTDLRAVPLVTIDGADARDFDDAVYAEPLGGGGFRLLVAIADVSAYVRPGTALDREALRRGNSCYFPDRVVPMLPEALSNGWCSLKPDADRACLFAEMSIDATGTKTAHRFGRGLMRSAARLTYDAVQGERDAGGDGTALGLPAGLLPTLFDAFAALHAARGRRGTLDLDLPERRITIGEDGRVASIAPRPRLDSHRLIEEFMVLANVAAAEETERLRRPCVFRVHAPPSPEKLESLREFLGSLDIPLKPAGELRPADLEAVLARVAGTDAALPVNEVVLRSQSQAAYDTDNIGHFGLNLRAYAHFTSPIRRYADLAVHRTLIAALKLGVGGLEAGAEAALPDVAEAVTATERRATLAERDANDRYLAAFMSDRTGAEFAARISGVTRFGLFVTLRETGASGLLPISSLPDDFWMHDEASHALLGRRTRVQYRLTDAIDVRLVEANALTGSLLFAPAGAVTSRPPRDARGDNRWQAGRKPRR